MADRDILTRVFISYRLMTEPCRADAREEARMRQKEGARESGQEGGRKEKGMGKERVENRDSKKMLEGERLKSRHTWKDRASRLWR